MESKICFIDHHQSMDRFDKYRMFYVFHCIDHNIDKVWQTGPVRKTTYLVTDKACPALSQIGPALSES